MTKDSRVMLQRHFDTALESPDGIKKLRELILTLGIQGKLVKQDPKDQPASELLKEIQAEKEKLVKAGKIRKQKELPPVEPDEVPYEVPEGWVLVRLGEIGFWKSGSTPSRSNNKYYGGNIPWVKSGEVKLGRISKTEEYITDEALKKSALSINEKGSILVAMYGANIGEVGILDIPATTNQAVCACKTYKQIYKGYLLYLISSLKPYFLSKGAGAAQPNISREKIIATPIFLPPLAEQKRIVAKIDQLMALCDKLEEQRKSLDQKRLAVHTSAVNRLLTAAGKNDFDAAWKFITDNFDPLYSVKENVAELKKAILTLAMQGKLVKQDPKDQPAGELLKEIQAEKEKLVKAGKIKKQKDLPEIKAEEVPYEVPVGWVWVRLDQIVHVGTGSTPMTTNNTYYNGDIPWYTSSATNNLVAEEPDKYITQKALSETNCKIFPSGSLIIALYGQGKTRGQISEILIPGATNQAIAAMVFLKTSSGVKNYLKYFFIKIYNEIRLLAEGGAQPNLNVGKIKNTLIPLPPLAEQKRIVAKIDQLMALCSTLEEKIEAGTRKQTALFDAVLAGV